MRVCRWLAVGANDASGRCEKYALHAESVSSMLLQNPHPAGPVLCDAGWRSSGVLMIGAATCRRIERRPELPHAQEVVGDNILIDAHI